MSTQLPIIVLANSDSRPGKVPAGMRQDEMLTGPKGTIQLQNGRCLAAELVQRIRASDRFHEPVLLGPKRWYDGKVDCEIVDVEGTLVQTLGRLTRTVHDRFRGHAPIAITACDVLPTAADFQQLVDRDYAPYTAAMFWWQMIESQTRDMGTSAWKPSYCLPPTAGQRPLTLYPGHMVIARPDALRMQLINRLLELAYKYRNVALEKRHVGITLGAIGALIGQDIRNLAKLELPLLSFVLPYVGLRGFYKYRHGTATLSDVEYFLTRTFLHRRHYRANARPTVISITSLRSFAKDIDTTAELEEVTSSLGGRQLGLQSMSRSGSACQTNGVNNTLFDV